MKLLGKTYDRLGSSTNKDTIDFREIFNREFSTEPLPDRYGNLESFVSHSSSQKEFRFSFLLSHPYIDDSFRVSLMVTIQSNKIKSGRLQRIEMVSVYENKTVLTISEAPVYRKDESWYFVQINLEYFYTKFVNGFDVKKNIQRIEEESKRTSFTELLYLRDKLNTLENIDRYLETKKDFFDFSFLWQRDQKVKAVFQKMVMEYYGKSYTESLPHFQRDIFRCLSNAYQILDNFSLINGKNIPDFSLRCFYVKKLIPPAYDENEDTFQKEFRELVQVDSKADSGFLEKVFIPLIKLIEEVDSNSISPNDSKRKLPFSPTTLELFFHNEFVFDVLLSLNKSLANFKEITFIDADRIEIKRSFLVNKKDNFSQLVKKLSMGSRDLDFINEWLSVFDIADEIQFDEENPEFFKVYLVSKSKKKMELADYGYGISQILPIILSLLPDDTSGFSTDKVSPKVVVIEEPENSLHPRLQSKLADMFAEAVNNFNIQLILETHSEYLIRKLQYLTIKGELKPEATQIYYFYHPDKIPPGEQQVKKINIQEDGSLTDDFGKGFFDEADKIAISIWDMNQSQRN